MDHGSHPATGSAGLDLAALLVRLVLLPATAFVAGTGLIRPSVETLPRRLWQVTAALGVVSAVLAVVSAIAFDVNVVGAVVHAALVLAVPVLALLRPPIGRWIAVALLVLLILETALGRSGVEFAIDTVYVAGTAVWFGLSALSLARAEAPRLGPLSWTLGGVLTLAAALQLVLSGVAFDRRLYETLFGVALLAAFVLPIVASVLWRRVAIVGVAAAFLAWSAFVAVPKPADLPVPGVPLLADAGGGPVLVSPQRPGRNLVHLPEPGSVRVGDGPVVQAVARPGASGAWAEVDLPTGRSELTVGDRRVEVDAGHETGPVTASGVDGPECATTALGGLIAGRDDILASCPADALSEEDAEALRKLVGFLASRQADSVTIVGDSSPRGSAAAQVVRAAATENHLTVRPDAAALVVVSGWARAASALDGAAAVQRERPAYPYGLYVAPWLLTGPLVNSVASSMAPLRFDPREQAAVSYAVALDNAFPGESPTVTGFQQWLGPEQPAPPRVQVYASAQVTAMPMNPEQPHAPGMDIAGEGPGHFIPQGTVVAISFPLG
ncbi:hypothetical protein GCM10027445_31700 [Amycolatopsis endophytica]|uniref:Uncharacterized protein n=1 Tax=Amycolatopsis endophytica TaxID=860233 RepID=A0A853B1U0_9PSEU|nr:hypothetical protein [Amycolatopsis endophytica]NYI88794.1 hypothetical protein [Amycolatopsis endophytica]